MVANERMIAVLCGRTYKADSDRGWLPAFQLVQAVDWTLSSSLYKEQSPPLDSLAETSSAIKATP